jgi:hypothetical protein
VEWVCGFGSGVGCGAPDKAGRQAGRVEGRDIRTHRFGPDVEIAEEKGKKRFAMNTGGG